MEIIEIHFMSRHRITFRYCVCCFFMGADRGSFDLKDIAREWSPMEGNPIRRSVREIPCRYDSSRDSPIECEKDPNKVGTMVTYIIACGRIDVLNS